jgi:hypothetical protein
MRWVYASVFVLAVPASALAQKTCEYAGQSYSVGATICECPAVEAENVDWQGDHSHITSRHVSHVMRIKSGKTARLSALT